MSTLGCSYARMDRNIIASHPPLLEHSLAIIGYGYSSLKPFTVIMLGLAPMVAGLWAKGLYLNLAPHKHKPLITANEHAHVHIQQIHM